MIRVGFIGLLLATMLSTDGVDRWRDGDRAYRSGDYERAVEAYTEALSQMDVDNVRRYRVQSNLGGSLYALGRHQEARDAYRQAAVLARTDSERARAAYNAGTISMEMADYRAALEHLRESVLADRSNDDARHNLELALRQTPPDDEGGSMMPSEDSSGEGDDGEDEETRSDAESDDDPDAEDEVEGEEGDESEEDSDFADESADDDSRDRSDGEPSHEPALSREQAERILQALESGEQEALRHVRQADAPQRRIEKDW
jgi:Ca-activated chloride channel homolog